MPVISPPPHSRLSSDPAITADPPRRGQWLLLALLLIASLCGVRLRAQTAGTLDSTYNPNVTGGHGYVLTTVVQPDGKAIIGGGFTSIGAFYPYTTRNNIARLNADGSVDASFNPGSGANNDVNCVAIQTDGKIVVGGSFTSMNGQARTYLCRLNSDGSLDSAFAPTVIGTAVYSLAIQADGKILAGGLFNSVNSSFRNNLVRLNTDGTPDSSFWHEAGSGAQINAIVVQPNGNILFAAANTIQWLSSTGLVGGSFTTGSGFTGNVNCLTLQSDGKLLAAGDFTSFNGLSIGRVARLNTDGSLDSTFNSGGAGANAAINGLSLETDGKLLLGGNFTTFNGSSSYKRLARLTTSGALDPTFSTASGPNATVYSIALQSDGKILLGGSFNFLNSTFRSLVGRLLNDAATQTLTKTSSSVVTWTRSGSTPEVWNTTFELSTDRGNTWTLLGSGARISGGWQLTGLSLPSSGFLRARAQAVGGLHAGGSSLIEQLAVFGGTSTAPVANTLGATPTASGNPNGGQVTYGAVLAGSVNALGNSTTVTFQYGPTTGYGSTLTASPSPVGGSTLTAVTASIVNLFSANTTYHYRVVATSSSGTTLGNDATFATLNSDASLSTLGVTGATLSPPFFPPPFPSFGGDYDAVVPSDATSATATFATTDPNATVSLNGTKLPAGTTSVVVPVAPGNNNETIVVTAQDGITTATNYLTITRTTVPISATGHTDVAATYATLKASVQAMATTATVTFEYGLDTNYGTTVSASNARGGWNSTIGAAVTGLIPGATYHYRVTVTNSQGSATSADATFTTSLATPPGSIDSSFTASANSIDATATQPDGKIVVSGFFTKINGATASDIARLNADGTLDPGFGASTNSEVNCVAVQADGRIVIGGSFTTVNGVAAKHLARLNSDGSLDSGFGGSADSEVASIAIQADGKILIGGYFSHVDSVAQQYLARLNTDGSLDLSFAPALDVWVNSIALQTDGKIVVGGWFSTVGGVTHNCIVRLNADGTTDSSFTAGADNPVNCVAVQADGKILLGGWFANVNGTARNWIARLNADGSLDTSFNPNVGGTGDQVYTVGSQADGKILIGGIFTTVSGTPRNYIARLNADGTLDSAFDPDANAWVYTVAPQANGEILVGGVFSTVFGQVHNGLALLVNDPAFQSISVPDLTQVQWLRSGSVPEVSYVTFDWSSDGGSTWTTLGSGTRMAGGWQLTGLNLPSTGIIRASGRTTSGENNGSSGLIQQTWSYPPAPQIAVEQPVGAALSSGTSTVDFGQLLVGVSASRTFTVRNLCNADLTGLGITIDGGNPGDFQVTTSPLAPVSGGGSTTFTVQFTAGALGARSATLHVASNVVGSSPFDIGLTGAGLTQLENWRLTWFGTTAGTGNAADAADPLADGVPNLLKFATGGNPTMASTAPGQVVLNGSNLEFTYQRSDGAMSDGIAFVVEWSDTLSGAWSNSGVTETILSDDGSMQQVKAVLPVGGNGQRFVHLRVTH